MCFRFLTNKHRGTLVKHKNKIYNSLTKPHIVDSFYKPTDHGMTLGEIKELADNTNSKFVVGVKKGQVLNNDTVVVGGNILINQIKGDFLMDKQEAKSMEHMRHLEMWMYIRLKTEIL